MPRSAIYLAAQLARATPRHQPRESATAPVSPPPSLLATHPPPRGTSVHGLRASLRSSFFVMTQVTEHSPPASGFVITAIRPAHNSLDTAVPVATPNTNAVSATSSTTAIPCFDFVPDISNAALALDTSPVSPVAKPPVGVLAAAEPDAHPQPPTVKPSTGLLSTESLSPVTSDTGTPSPPLAAAAAPPLVAGYDSDTSTDSATPPVAPKKARARRRVRFADKVEIRIIPNNLANQLREAQEEVEDLVDSMGAHSTTGVHFLDGDAAPLPPLIKHDALSLHLFEVDGVNAVDDLGLLDAEEAERYDDAVQRDLEGRVERLRNKLKRKRGGSPAAAADSDDDSAPVPTDLLGDELPITADEDADVLTSLAKKPRLINCQM